MQLTFLRRKALGAGSIRGMLGYLTDSEPSSISVRSWSTNGYGVLRNDREINPDGGLLVRWGCTSRTTVPLSQQVNPSEAIKEVNRKGTFRLKLSERMATGVPSTIAHNVLTSFDGRYVLRPETHAQGKNLWVVNNLDELLNVVREHPSVFSQGWYASEFIDKVMEVRVYVVNGRVATVARKTPEDPSAVAWNVAQGGRFDVMRWGDWPLEACRVACEAFSHTSLDFGGVDVMLDAEGNAYIIEINSAPSLPLLSDGSVSYRQKCMAKCFQWIIDNGRETAPVDHSAGWRGYIHPAIA